ncbi:MAG TPA: nuclear transport factor 2 family protein [Myxococcales bacterium]|nr:nuclear transport factor 2 family protein [Myxococcales bacterium]HIK85499.1 nuclear transport factor 2 family protein [Myxococcales bacterium]
MTRMPMSYVLSIQHDRSHSGAPLSYTPEQLCDLESIRDAALRYCRGVDRLDVELMKSAYWAEATDDHGVFVGNAWVFCENCMESHLRWRSTSHCIFNHSIDLGSDGVRARGEIYNVTYLFQQDVDVLDTWHGRYLDLYEKRGDEWRILERVCVHEGSHSAPIQPMAFDASKFRVGSFDRATPGRRIGP